MAKTISTHNGSAANREHNVRNPRATDKQEHIDKSLKGRNEILHDEKPREAYRRIFGKALDEYNAKQSREERKIRDYFAHVEKDSKKHTVYEMIVQIGDRHDTGIDAPVERECLKEFYSGWKGRNPHLECIGAYLHADEADGTVHLHIDYVPVATGYTRGMEIQTGLVKALEQQGFVKVGARTAQIQWEARENAALEEICERHGIEVEHPMAKGEKRKHLDTDLYKAQKQLDETKQQLVEAEQDLAATMDFANEITGRLTDVRQDLDNSSQKLAETSKRLEDVQADLKPAEQQKEALNAQIEGLQNDVASLEGKKGTLEADVAALQTKKDVLTAAEVAALKGTKTITGGLKGVTYTEFEALKKTAAKVENMEREVVRIRQEGENVVANANRQLAEHKARLDAEYRELTETALTSGNVNVMLQQHRELETVKRENAALRRIVNAFTRALESIREAAPAIHKKIAALVNPEINQANREMDPHSGRSTKPGHDDHDDR